MDGLRKVTPADIPELERLRREQAAELGWNVECIDHFAPPVLVTYVHERDGKIVGGVAFEAVPEMQFLSSDPESTAYIKKHAPEILSHLMLRGFNRVRSFVPKVNNLPEVLGEHFRDCDFAGEDESLSHFSISLRAADGAEKELSHE